MFQRQSLSIQRKKAYELMNHVNENSRFYNRDYLPRICMNVDIAKTDYLFNINIIFNDFYQTGESSLLNGTKYRIKIHSFDYTEPLNFNNIYAEDLFRIKSKLVLDEDKLLKLNDMIEIKNLIQSKYFLEVTYSFFQI